MNLIDLIIVIMIMITFCLIFFVKKTYCMDNFLFVIALIAPVFFSIFGIVYEKYDNNVYLFSFIVFYIVFLTTTFFTVLKTDVRKKNKITGLINRTLKNNIKIFNTLGWLALILKLTILVYPNFKLFSLFTPWKLTYTFSTGEYFSSRLFERSDIISRILTISRSSLYPFIFIMLYNKKDKPVKFSLIYFFYFYIDYVNESYIQRNKIIAMIVFLLGYLIYEKIIKKKKLIVILPIVCIFLVVVTNFLYSYRLGIVNKSMTVKESVVSIIDSESGTQQYIDICDRLSQNISFPKMVLSIVSAPLFFLPNISFPTLAYYFTEAITGVEYGGTNYYILLPGFYEEAVLIFGKNLSFLYGFFVAIFLGLIYNFYKKIDMAKFFLLNIIINFGSACRGTLQSFMLQQTNLFVAFVTVVFTVYILKRMVCYRNE